MEAWVGRRTGKDIMENINARERGHAAFGRGKTRQPMNDTQFVKLMYEAVTESDGVPRTVKAYYILEWKGGWEVYQMWF